jgi:hypothetical protein
MSVQVDPKLVERQTCGNVQQFKCAVVLQVIKGKEMFSNFAGD